MKFSLKVDEIFSGARNDEPFAGGDVDRSPPPVQEDNPPTTPDDFLNELNALMAREGRSKSLGLLVIQIDESNRVNTTLGYGTGATLQSQFEARLKSIDKALLAQRIADRKFAVVLETTSEGEILKQADRILPQVPQMSVGDKRFVVDAAVGIALFPEHAQDADELCRRAELGLLSARKNSLPYQMYSLDSTVQVANLWLLESELGEAMMHGQLRLHYQPKVRLADGVPVGVEGLMRWHTPTRGFVPPDDFIPIAERTGLIQEMTWMALAQAAADAQQWPDRWGRLCLSINVTPGVLQDAELMNHVAATMSSLETTNAQLALELTESTFMDDPETCLQTLNRLRDAAVQLSIDDFGTGFSSLSYMKGIPARELKIDKSFIQNILTNETDRHIVRSVVELAQGFGMQVAAEGVEDAQTLRAVVEAGCDIAQGYHICPPLPHDELLTWLATMDPQPAATAEDEAPVFPLKVS